LRLIAEHADNELFVATMDAVKVLTGNTRRSRETDEDVIEISVRRS